MAKKKQVEDASVPNTQQAEQGKSPWQTKVKNNLHKLTVQEKLALQDVQ